MKMFKLVLAVATAAFLASCGGGGNDAAPAPQAPAPDGVTISGTVTGFGGMGSGGLAVDGVTYDDRAAVVARDIDPSAETAASMADVKVGQQVEVAMNGSGQAAKVLVRATAIGPVQSIDLATASFKVVGQTVKVVTTGEGKTMFEGVADLAGLKVNDWVEVHGTLDATANIVATRVEVKSAAGMTAVRAGGIVKDHNAAAKTFKLGELTVNYTNATVKPDGATIANDKLVFVYSDQLPANNTLTAKSVRVVEPPSIEGRKFVVGGLVTDYVSIANFRVMGLKVDATNAEIKNGVAADIKNMALVRIEGSITTAGGAIVLKAERVWIIPASEQRRIVLAGQITDFVSAASFRVRGVPVNADMATFKNGVKADLANGAFVMIKGRIDGNVVKADEVMFDVPPRDVDFKLFGTVANYDAVAKTFTLLGIPMKLDAMVTYKNGMAADFKNGAFVEVRGMFNGTVFLVKEVEFKPAPPNPAIMLEGTISDVAATSFKLNGATIKLTTTTVIEGGPLANGQRVEVTAQLVGADLVALKVEVQVPGATARLMGPITDFVSAANFKVQGQTVDASAAMFQRGTAADLANGKMVRVDGPLAAGKVMATRVHFLGP
jgi:hypothetical protein